jgi:hypothetical protein
MGVLLAMSRIVANLKIQPVLVNFDLVVKRELDMLEQLEIKHRQI